MEAVRTNFAWSLGLSPPRRWPWSRNELALVCFRAKCIRLCVDCPNHWNPVTPIPGFTLSTGAVPGHGSCTTNTWSLGPRTHAVQ